MQGRVRWHWAAVGLMFAVPGLAAPPLGPLLACRSITVPAARLVCYDREVARLAATPAPASPAASAALPSPPASPPRHQKAPLSAQAQQNFGLPEDTITQREVAAGTRAAELRSIEAHLVRVSTTGSGLATFSLDNGEVWQQLLPEGDLLARPGDAVKISRQAFHSYWLQVPTGRGCKVQRIR